jgi:hypothetical protein
MLYADFTYFFFFGAFISDEFQKLMTFDANLVNNLSWYFRTVQVEGIYSSL